MRNTFYGFLVLLFTTALAAPAPASDQQHTLEGRNGDGAVIFVAHDYGFRGPEQIPAGLTTVRIVNQGQDLHHIQFLKLLRGKSAADFRSAIAADPRRLPDWVQYAGGPNAHLPGSLASATVNLTEGDYVVICRIPDRNGVPHVALGMQKAFFVRGGGKPTKVSAPKASVSIKQIDYQFVFSKRIERGMQTIEVMNQGTQPHELVIVKLARGATVKEAIASFEPGSAGPPLGELVGGITGIEKGRHVHFTGEFEPGRYGLICFFPDATTGRPHFLHGMTAEFTVE
jgi:uncharacterized cupredoxin-like copper-binding protein